MSNQIPVFPLNAIAYNSDRSITNPTDVLNHLAVLDPKISKVLSLKAINAEQGPTEFVAVEQVDDPLIHRYRYNIGPVEVALARNVETADYSLQVFVMIPLMGHVLVGATTGNLRGKRNGVVFRHGKAADGSVTITLDDKYQYVLVYDFTAFGEPFKGSINVVSNATAKA